VVSFYVTGPQQPLFEVKGLFVGMPSMVPWYRSLTPSNVFSVFPCRRHSVPILCGNPARSLAISPNTAYMTLASGVRAGDSCRAAA